LCSLEMLERQKIISGTTTFSTFITNGTHSNDSSGFNN
jgi:hypothetical protein